METNETRNTETETNETETNETDKQLSNALKQIADLQKSKSELIENEKHLRANLKALNEKEDLAKGNYEKIIAENKIELEDLRNVKEQLDNLKESIRTELIQQLPDNHKTIAQELPIDTLRMYVKLNASEGPGKMDDGKSGKGKIDVTGKKWDDFTSAELNDLNKSNPSSYKILRSEKFKF